MTWLMENAATILISAALVAAVAGILWSRLRARRRGASSCGCGCAGCGMQDACHGKK